MGKFKKEDFENLSDEQIRKFLTGDKDKLPSFIKDFIGNDQNDLNRVYKLLSLIVVDRFINYKLNN